MTSIQTGIKYPSLVYVPPVQIHKFCLLKSDTTNVFNRSIALDNRAWYIYQVLHSRGSCRLKVEEPLVSKCLKFFKTQKFNYWVNIFKSVFKNIVKSINTLLICYPRVMDPKATSRTFNIIPSRYSNMKPPLSNCPEGPRICWKRAHKF